jgi:hypothetical protein
MNNLLVKDRSLKVMRILTGILIIIIGSSWIFLFTDSHKSIYLAVFIFFFISGLFIIFNGLNIEKATIRKVEGGIKIKWINRILSRYIRTSEIENIILGKSSIQIKITGRAPLKLKIETLRYRQKEKVYDYFEKFSKENGIRLMHRY